MIYTDVHISNNNVIFYRQYRGLTKKRSLKILLENIIVGNLIGVDYKIISKV
jgi:hypothetical protein